MQHTADIDDIAAIVGDTVDIVTEFTFPLIEPGVFACIMYMAAEHPAMRRVAMIVKHDRVVAQDQVVKIGRAHV